MPTWYSNLEIHYSKHTFCRFPHPKDHSCEVSLHSNQTILFTFMVTMATTAILKLSSLTCTSTHHSRREKKFLMGFYSKHQTMYAPRNIPKEAPVQNFKPLCTTRYISINPRIIEPIVSENRCGKRHVLQKEINK